MDATFQNNQYLMTIKLNNYVKNLVCICFYTINTTNGLDDYFLLTNKDISRFYRIYHYLYKIYIISLNNVMFQGSGKGIRNK